MQLRQALIATSCLALALVLFSGTSGAQQQQQRQRRTRTRPSSDEVGGDDGFVTRDRRQSFAGGRQQQQAYPARIRSSNGRAAVGGGAAGGGSPSSSFVSRHQRKPLLRVPKPEAFEEDRRIEQEAQDRRSVVDAQDDSFGAANDFQDAFSDIQKQTMSDADAQARHYGAPNYDGALPGGSGRMAFQIHGHQGPQSYRYGFDTGKGYNRQFRYEEKDAHGVVHGRYGYYDKAGKLRIVNYTAHPKHGFAAEGDFGKYP